MGNFAIDKSTIDKTTACKGDFACLSTGKCKENFDVSFVVGDGRLILRDKCDDKCAYYQKSGWVHLCTCPTNNAIHELMRNSFSDSAGNAS